MTEKQTEQKKPELTSKDSNNQSEKDHSKQKTAKGKAEPSQNKVKELAHEATQQDIDRGELPA